MYAPDWVQAAIRKKSHVKNPLAKFLGFPTDLEGSYVDNYVISLGVDGVVQPLVLFRYRPELEEIVETVSVIKYGDLPKLRLYEYFMRGNRYMSTNNFCFYVDDVVSGKLSCIEEGYVSAKPELEYLFTFTPVLFSNWCGDYRLDKMRLRILPAWMEHRIPENMYEPGKLEEWDINFKSRYGCSTEGKVASL